MEESSDNQNQPNESSDNQDQKSVSSNLVEASFKLIGDLRKAKSEGFNLWAFLFPYRIFVFTFICRKHKKNSFSGINSDIGA